MGNIEDALGLIMAAEGNLRAKGTNSEALGSKLLLKKFLPFLHVIMYAKFLENADIATVCSDGIVRIWTVNHENLADAVELDPNGFVFGVGITLWIWPIWLRRMRLKGIVQHVAGFGDEYGEKLKSHKGKVQTSEGRKQLESVRVIQRNLVYVVVATGFCR
ncbi:hypothetical protein CASFOL_002128 [Castilleja foliolosa]|uniref:Uncharacterized protein n=1 Tax=Castilleja foliolosa TaxID=1961234 RepID=A0ABD3EFB0_9LAMI